MFRSLSTKLASSPVFKYPGTSHLHVRTVQHRAYDTYYDQDDLVEARKWHASFNENSLPKGHTSYSRSSGPGGQHVNKTESKATTVWPIEELSKDLPKLMRAALRSSKYYSKRNDSITIQAQTQRNRTANTEENHHKLLEELHRMYKDHVPGETSEETIKKYEDLAKSYHESRLQSKKQHSSKKASRKGTYEE
ncbi:uncharacterized protein GGS22DRAFT_159189 [Annulohypoxylon maeteangense]|uniref:uncharacterized protein n=1 Tax=Annulohypoxylon maeteangense TaxID=1927788 RepID=UPI002007A524|nr:uncharacterized protein GGS22DRAFT_159189 [Annulohypoxylon maeteangense]KAI0887019.1 hypothetical protein GGS22DRAFT_159189 [Annulohypoxylon maeteangense]